MVFQSSISGGDFYKVIFESFYTNIQIVANALDVFTKLLNFEEQKKSTDSKFRLYGTSTMPPSDHCLAKFSDAQRLRIFTDNLENRLRILNIKTLKIRKTVCAYLDSIGCNISKTMEMAENNRVELPWRTLDNKVDCGIFAMCHMETFMGSTTWQCGFDPEKELEKQTRQITELLYKYISKILLSDLNNFKDKHLEYAKEFSKSMEGRKEDKKT
ncbi:hypothetical protein L1987_57513 [Smallanthus sonchifolius]|uniref:Uncharacterized protein n=1 Tax=Smallanthus sonchifolius TaxID=185202 RepID=A0ACB9DD77_9ASTR|nr:hypothetical protein L1987_57513 [Smallanthus sonchifolius]